MISAKQTYQFIVMLAAAAEHRMRSNFMFSLILRPTETINLKTTFRVRSGKSQTLLQTIIPVMECTTDPLHVTFLRYRMFLSICSTTFCLVPRGENYRYNSSAFMKMDPYEGSFRNVQEGKALVDYNNNP